MFNLTKHMVFKNLQTISSDMKAVQSNLKAKQWVLEQKHKIPMQAQIEGIESKYKLDYFKYSSLCYIYAIIKHARDEEAERILSKYPINFLSTAIYEELWGTNRYEKIMDEYNEKMDIPEIKKYMEYFGGYER